jgi:DtxR family transcriptional regulator, Mn-dependent transcriptional regulator
MDSYLSKSEREMLKAVYRLTKGGSDAHTGALAEHLGISPGTVTATIKRLAEREFIDHRPYKGVELTKAGRHAAVAAIRRHRIVERFLSDMLGYAWNEADRLAGAFEHELPQEIEDRLYETLGKPATCPHGFPIPDPATDRILQMPSLDELKVGDAGVVALSGSTDQEILDFLETLGIRPGSQIEVVAKHPFDGPIVVNVEGKEQTVGERLAERIFVKSRHLAAANPGRPEIQPVDALNTDRGSERPERDGEPTTTKPNSKSRSVAKRKESA